MRLSRLNLLSALVSFGLSCIWLAMGQSLAGMIWLICSLAWFVLSIKRREPTVTEPRPVSRLLRRLWRLAIWS